MELHTFRTTLADFATDPNKSWGQPYGGGDFLSGTQARVPIEQSDRNTARLRSGTYTRDQLADFDAQLERVEAYGGTARFSYFLPDCLEFCLVCVDCKKPFASSLADAARCYDCELLALCPLLPHRDIHHMWFYNDHEWTLQVFGDVGGRNELTYWWSHAGTGSNVGHQGLTAYRTPDGTIKKLVFSTVAMKAARLYTIVWDIEADTTKYFSTKTTSVNQGYCGQMNELDSLDPLVLDLILAMIPAFMLHKHRPRNPANGCYSA